MFLPFTTLLIVLVILILILILPCIFQSRAEPPLNTGALARCKNAPVAAELFQQFAGSHGKPLKRLLLASTSPHRAKAPVLMRSSSNRCEIFGLIVICLSALLRGSKIAITITSKITNKIKTASSPFSLFALAAFVSTIGGVSNGLSQELFLEKSDIAPAVVDKIYVRGLQFLLRTQSSEGSWSDKPYGSEPAVVALAVISMLAHGDDPNFGPLNQPIRRGLEFILKQMNKQTGYIGRTMYNHGFGTLALAEAYGAVDDPRLGPALEQAVRLILKSQERNPQGAWRYSPESDDADTTVSGAQLVALFAARNAGIAVPQEAIQKGLKFFLLCQTADGGFGYTSGNSPNAARTAIGCLVFALAKEKNTKAFQSAFTFLKRAPPETHYREYYLYYASQAFFQASQDTWQSWNRANIKALAASQNPDGSWDGQFGSAFSTAASLLSLALNYRFLPIYER